MTADGLQSNRNSNIRKICYLWGWRWVGHHEMKATLIVSSRGQITLPAATRKRLGIKGGDVVILEDRGNEIVLKPGVVLEVELYSDAQIAEWDAADRLDKEERDRIVAATTGPR